MTTEAVQQVEQLQSEQVSTQRCSDSELKGYKLLMTNRWFMITITIIYTLISFAWLHWRGVISYSFSIDFWLDFVPLLPLYFTYFTLSGFTAGFSRRYVKDAKTGIITTTKESEQVSSVNERKRPYDNLFLVVCARGLNQAALQRTWNALKPLENKEARVSVKIVTEPDAKITPDMPVVIVPKSFKCKFARHKARALEYFRMNAGLRDDDWIMHLDEESIIDKFTIESVLNFIESSDYFLGQGVILYNQHNYWKNPLFTVADHIRVGDDVGRFHDQYAKVHRPIWGSHGSFLLTNVRVENTVTWDNDSLTEDFFFSVTAGDMGFQCGHIAGFCREQSPDNIIDFIKQRRRWFLGVWQSSHPSARRCVFMWMVGAIGVIYEAIRAFIGPKEIPFWVALSAALNACTFQSLYIVGCIIQDIDAGSNIFVVIFHVILTIVLQPICGLMELLPVVYAIFMPTKTFDIIAK